MKSFKDMLDETATWKVKVQGLPGMYMNGKSAGEVKNKLRNSFRIQETLFLIFSVLCLLMLKKITD